MKIMSRNEYLIKLVGKVRNRNVFKKIRYYIRFIPLMNRLLICNNRKEKNNTSISCFFRFSLRFI